MGSNSLATITALAVVVVASILCSANVEATTLFPEVEITLANDGSEPIWYMCQGSNKKKSLSMLPPNGTYRFTFTHIAFPVRWCYLYINPRSHGFFFAYTVRSRCTKCFWSINEHPALYRNDKGRWERQRLFMPPEFNINEYLRKSSA